MLPSLRATLGDEAGDSRGVARFFFDRDFGLACGDRRSQPSFGAAREFSRHRRRIYGILLPRFP